MNPVDHVRAMIPQVHHLADWNLSSLTVVVTINISVKRRPFRDTLLRVKRQVSLLRGGQDCCVVHKRPRTEWIDDTGNGRCKGISCAANSFNFTECEYIGDSLSRRPDRLQLISAMTVLLHALCSENVPVGSGMVACPVSCLVNAHCWLLRPRGPAPVLELQ